MAPPPSPSSQSIQLFYVPVLLAYVDAKGGDAAAIASRYRLPWPLEAGRPVEIPMPTVREICGTVERTLGDPFVGLRAALNMRRGAYDLVEFVLRSAPTLGEGLERAMRYQRLMNSRAVFALKREGALATIEHHMPGEPFGVTRQANEFTLVALLKTCREMVSSPLVPRRVSFQHPRPPELSELVAFFGTDQIEFGRSHNAMTFETSVLAVPLVSADQGLMPVLDRYAKSLLPQAVQPPGLIAEVREQIRRTLDQGPPDIGAVASAQRMSARTLQRRLGEEGTSFAEVLDDVRRDVALRCVTDPRLSITEVAFLAGYSDSRAFARAFTRWTGIAPLKYRQGANSK